MHLQSQRGSQTTGRQLDPAAGPQAPSHCGTQYPDVSGQKTKLLLALFLSTPSPFSHGFLTNFGTVTAAINTVLAFSPQGTLEIPAMNVPSFAGTLLGTASGEPGLVCLQMQKSWRQKRSRQRRQF